MKNTEKQFTYTAQGVKVTESFTISNAAAEILAGNERSWAVLTDEIRSIARHSSVCSLINSIAKKQCVRVMMVLDDAVSEMTIKLLYSKTAIKKLVGKSDGYFYMFVKKCMTNWCIDQLRRRYYTPMCCLDDCLQLAVAESSFDAEDAARLHSSIDTLPMRQRTAINVWLQLVGEGDYDQMAAQAGVSRSAFAKSLCLGKQNIAAQYRHSA